MEIVEKAQETSPGMHNTALMPLLYYVNSVLKMYICVCRHMYIYTYRRLQFRNLADC